MLQKLKSATFSVLPIILVVLLIHFTMYRFSGATILNFIIGLALLIVGQSVFLTGIDISVVPMGEYVGNSVSDKKQFYVFIIFGLIFGIVSTIAEPDFQVIANNIVLAGVGIPKWVILIGVGLGVGILLSIGLTRIVLGYSLNITLALLYTIATFLAVMVSEMNFSISLDAGAGTIGVITSPFLLALGIGVAKIVTHSRNTDSGAQNFGLISLSSVGALIAMLVLTLIFGGSGETGVVSTSNYPLWITILIDVTLSLLPLIIVFFIFEAIYIKISRQEKRKLLFGSLVTFVGFYVFLYGIEFGFSNMGYEFGNALLEIDNTVFTVFICALLGFFIVFCEPSIRILAKQIEEVTNRNIRSKLVVGAIAFSVVLSITLSILRIYYQFSIWWIFGTIYGLAFILMPFVPKLFSAIAFDSGGSATGALTVAFMLPIMLGLSGGGAEGFGTIGIMIMTPVLVIEILGLVYNFMMKAEIKKNQQLLLRLSRTEDKFSNIEKLKVLHEREFDGRVF